MGSSIETINYGLRPNKAIERKLIFEVFAKISHKFNFSSYRYLGFGALHFADFLLAHKHLRMDDLISIEYERNAQRAASNSPLGCIKVIGGDCSTILTNGAVNLTEKRHIAWLDYDGVVDTSVLTDLETLCTKLPSGSFVAVTANATRAYYQIPQEDGSPLGLKDSLINIFGSKISELIKPNTDSSNGFPPVLADMLITHCGRCVNKMHGEKAKFYPLFNFFYKDGSLMITIGGAILSPEEHKLLEECEVYLNPFVTKEEQIEINLPLLTRHERAILDKLLPSATLDLKVVQRKLGFRLHPTLCESYRKLYNLYPHFSEVISHS
jgi:hypothetical protein